MSKESFKTFARGHTELANYVMNGKTYMSYMKYMVRIVVFGMIIFLLLFQLL